MLFKYDLTERRFDQLDMDEAVLSFRADEHLPEMVRVLAWGVIFHPERQALDPTFPVSTGARGGIYVSGWSRLTLERVVGGDFTASPYEPTLEGPGKAFIRKDGGHLELSRSWGESEERQLAIEYPLGTFLEFPYGNVQATFYAKGPVYIDLDPAKFVAYEEYLKAPREFGIDWWHERWHI